MWTSRGKLFWVHTKLFLGISALILFQSFSLLLCFFSKHSLKVFLVFVWGKSLLFKIANSFSRYTSHSRSRAKTLFFRCECSDSLKSKSIAGTFRNVKRNKLKTHIWSKEKRSIYLSLNGLRYLAEIRTAFVKSVKRVFLSLVPGSRRNFIDAKCHFFNRMHLHRSNDNNRPFFMRNECMQACDTSIKRFSGEIWGKKYAT